MLSLLKTEALRWNSCLASVNIKLAFFYLTEFNHFLWVTFKTFCYINNKEQHQYQILGGQFWNL